jgi:hypothetical protein
VAQLWIIAVGSGIALTVAVASLPLSPRARRKWGPGARFGLALLATAACSFFVLGRTARSDDEAVDGLHLYILATLTLVILRVLFARWLKRYVAAQMAGKPMQASAGKVTVVFLGAFVVVVAALVGVLTWLPTLWA